MSELELPENYNCEDAGSVYFRDQKSKDKFKSITMDVYNSPTSLQAVDVEKLIEKEATNVRKMNSFEAWWW